MRLKRIISAVILLTVSIGLAVAGGYALGALVLVMACAGIYEIFKAFEQKGFRPVWPVGYFFAIPLIGQVLLRAPDIFSVGMFRPYSAASTDAVKSAGTASAANAADTLRNNINLFGLCLVIAVTVLLTVVVFGHKKYTPADAAVTLLGGLYVTVLLSFAISLRDYDASAQNDGLFLFITAFLTDVAADTAAYEIGCRWGKRKLIPEVSPNKTVEGSIAAVVGAVLSAFLLGLLFVLTGWYTFIKLYWYPVIGLLIGFVSQLGDLAASVIKRFTGIKDFSNIIPGHGGVLDRLDSLMFVFPTVYYLLRLVLSW